MESRWVIMGSVHSGDREGAYHLGALAQSKLAKTLRQARRIAPIERIVPVVLDAHRPWWGPLLEDVPEQNLVVEPFDRGTAAGILVAVVRILRWDSKADVAIIDTDRKVTFEDIAGTFDVLLDAARQKDRCLDSDDGALIAGSVDQMLGLFQDSQPMLLKTYLTELAGAAVFSDEALSAVYPFLPEVPFHTGVFDRPHLDGAPGAASA